METMYASQLSLVVVQFVCIFFQKYPALQVFCVANCLMGSLFQNILVCLFKSIRKALLEEELEVFWFLWWL